MDTEFVYTPDEDLKVHQEGAIRLICKAFQSHESGLPEWLKNSADAYAREDAAIQKRVILVSFDYGRKSIEPSISCVDFVGMTSNQIEKYFRNWADPDASTQKIKSTGIQGGHGNGGKCYMTQMFDQYAYIQTYKKEKKNSYGASAGSFKFGYIPDRERGRDVSFTCLEEELETVLREIRISFQNLPKEASEAIKRTDGFTIVRGVGPKGYGNKIPYKHLIETLQGHPQMIRTLEMCKVFVFVNGELSNGGKELVLPIIPPMEGAEKPKVLTVPDILKDPYNNEEVSTTQSGKLKSGVLTLRTSQVSMRWKKSVRHNITYKTDSGYIGYVPVIDLDVQSSYRDYIYGECYLESLEPLKQNDRARLATCPLTRAVERFISEQVEKLAKEFEDRERRRYNQEEKNALSRMNEALDRWKNRFLSEFMSGIWGEGEGGTPPPPTPLKAGKATRLELQLTHPRAGLGISFKPTLKFYDRNGIQIRPVPYKWISEDTNVAMVDEDLMIINTFSYGNTVIYAETIDGKLRSNKVPLEVVRIYSIDITPRKIELGAGGRQKLEALCRLANNDEVSNIYLEWTEDNPNIAKVSSSGLVFGFALGETTVTAGDDKCDAKERASVTVVPAKEGGSGDKRSRGYPKILISEVDTDPATGQMVPFKRDEPPVCQRPQDYDRNIWWINSAAPLAHLYLNTQKGYGYESREWRIYHLERYIDIIAQIALVHGPKEIQSMSANEWITNWGHKISEIQAAAAADLGEFIANGQLPEG